MASRPAIQLGGFFGCNLSCSFDRSEFLGEIVLEQQVLVLPSLEEAVSGFANKC